MIETTLQSEITIPSKIEGLATVNDFLRETLSSSGLEEPKIADVQIAVSEACTNIIQYGYGNADDGKIVIRCSLSDHGCIIKIRDYGKPFNPLSVAAPTVNGSLAERTIGGLGIFFMKQLLDELKYEYNDEHGYETLTMVKYS